MRKKQNNNRVVYYHMSPRGYHFEVPVSESEWRDIKNNFKTHPDANDILFSLIVFFNLLRNGTYQLYSPKMKSIFKKHSDSKKQLTYTPIIDFLVENNYIVVSKAVTGSKFYTLVSNGCHMVKVDKALCSRLTSRIEA